MASADNRIGDSLHRRLDALHEAERRILDKARRPARVAVDTQAKHDEQTTFGENTADNPGRSASRWRFILSVLAAIAVGITLIARRRPSGAGGQDAPEQAGAVR